MGFIVSNIETWLSAHLVLAPQKPNPGWIYVHKGESIKYYNKKLIFIIIKTFIFLYHYAGVCLKQFNNKSSQEVFDSFPCGKGASFTYFLRVVFNIMSLCRGGTTYLATCGWGKGMFSTHQTYPGIHAPPLHDPSPLSIVYMISLITTWKKDMISLITTWKKAPQRKIAQ